MGHYGVAPIEGVVYGCFSNLTLKPSQLTTNRTENSTTMHIAEVSFLAQS
jgi:hypothetical protein